MGVAACPQCGDQFRLPTDSQALPDHGFIDTLVALKKIANENMEDDSCDICRQLSASSEPVAAAEYYCIECRQRMCAVCARPHPLCPATKDHNVFGLGLDSVKEVLHTLKSFTPVCVNHKDKSATIHCYKCSVGLCSQCQDVHSSHEIAELTDDTYGQLKNTVKFVSVNLRQQLDACKKQGGRVQQLRFEMHKNVEIAQKEIYDKADEMMQLIQKECNDLLSTLHSNYYQAISGLEAVSTRLLLDVSKNIKALKFAEELLEKGSVEDMLLSHRLLNDRVMRLRNMSGDSSVLDDKDVSPASFIRDVLTSLKSKSK